MLVFVGDVETLRLENEEVSLLASLWPRLCPGDRYELECVDMVVAEEAWLWSETFE